MNLLFTGGTGFFGKSFLDELLLSEDKRKNIQITLLSRNSGLFVHSHPEYGSLKLEMIEADVRHFRLPEKKITHLIHAATSANSSINQSQPSLMYDTIVNGTKQILEVSKRLKVKKLVLISSGAVLLPEGLSAYADGKREAEALCKEASKSSEFEICIARCFAFSGPRLALDGTYAFGNFIQDALRGGPVQVKGDGSAIRSYLDSSDLASALFLLLEKGVHGALYDVGSEEAISIKELAEKIAQIAALPEPGAVIEKKVTSGMAPDVYLPKSNRLKTELGFQQTVSLNRSIEKTLDWHRRKPS